MKIVRTPAKVLLFGEHSVVYGKTAVAATIARYTFAACQPSDHVHFVVPEFGVNFEITLDELEEKFGDFLCGCDVDAASVNIETLKQAQSVLEKRYAMTHEQAIASLAFLVAFHLLNETRKSGLKICIRSTVPMASGLGSSASFAVSIGACLLNFYKKNFNFDLELINKWGFYLEKIMHGNVSGVDNTVCTFGGFLEYRNKPERSLKKIDCKGDLSLIFSNTNVPKNTKVQVAKVSQLFERFPEILEPILNSMDTIAKEAIKCLTSENQMNTISDIQNLFRINQSLLSALNVSHRAIDDICAISREFGLESKLTGAGGGGSVISISKNDSLHAEFIRKLNESSYSSFKTTIGCPGVQIKEKSLSLDEFMGLSSLEGIFDDS